MRTSDAGDFYRANKKRAVVSLKLFIDRVYKGTPWEEALTRESRKGSSHLEFYRNSTEPNKISYRTFNRRIVRGMSPDKAIKKNNTASVKYTTTQAREIYEANKHRVQVSFRNFYDRINSGTYTINEAIEQPLVVNNSRLKNRK